MLSRISFEFLRKGGDIKAIIFHIVCEKKSKDRNGGTNFKGISLIIILGKIVCRDHDTGFIV